jgi:hypothetical protein
VIDNPKKLLWACTLGILLVAGWQWARAENQPETIKGYVLDSTCAFTKNLKKPISADCAVACAKAGSPLVILSDKGTIYWPISDSTPARGQNERLMEFAGKRVSVTGKVYQRGGSSALIISAIKVSE